MTKLGQKPAYCASCFQQEPVRYVDFEAAYDGPVIPGAVNIPIDDLIICENCLGEAFELLDPQSKDETIKELTDLLLDAQAEIDAKDKAIRGFQFTTTELIEHPIAKFPGKPRLEGVPTDIRERITQGLYKRRGTSSAPKKKAAA